MATPGLPSAARMMGTLRNAIILPERAVTQQQATRLVLVVNDKNIVEARPVVIGRNVGGEVLVESGVKAGERVIVDGLFKSRPGSEVKPVAAREGPAAERAVPPRDSRATTTTSK